MGRTDRLLSVAMVTVSLAELLMVMICGDLLGGGGGGGFTMKTFCSPTVNERP